MAKVGPGRFVASPAAGAWRSLKREFKIMWNLVDPRHGGATVVVSKRTGDIVSIERKDRR